MRLTPPESDSSSLNSMELERERCRHDDSDTGESHDTRVYCLNWMLAREKGRFLQNNAVQCHRKWSSGSRRSELRRFLVVTRGVMIFSAIVLDHHARSNLSLASKKPCVGVLYRSLFVLSQVLCLWGMIALCQVPDRVTSTSQNGCSSIHRDRLTKTQVHPFHSWETFSRLDYLWRAAQDYRL